MKPKSKKDQFVIKINNGEEVKKVKDYYCADNTDSWIHFNFAILHDDIGKYSMLYDYLPDKYSNLPVISFDQWQSLPDFPKPEYDPKDVAFNNYEQIKEALMPFNGTLEDWNSKFNPKKIIGYKLIKPEYKKAVKAILENGDSSWFSNFDLNLIESGYNFVFCDTLNSVHNQLETAGVMHWFEPVYDTSITLKSGVKLSQDDIAEVKEILNTENRNNNLI